MRKNRFAKEWSATWISLGSIKTLICRREDKATFRVIVSKIFYFLKIWTTRAFSLKISKEKGILKVHVRVVGILTETWKETKIQKDWFCWQKVSKRLLILLEIFHMVNKKLCSTKFRNRTTVKLSVGLKQASNRFKGKGSFESVPEISKKVKKKNISVT